MRGGGHRGPGATPPRQVPAHRLERLTPSGRRAAWKRVVRQHPLSAGTLPKKQLAVAPPQDEDEWRQWGSVGDPLLHIELRRWADALVVAPLSANMLVKVAGGLCDKRLTCVVRAWDSQRPLLVIGVATLPAPSTHGAPV